MNALIPNEFATTGWGLRFTTWDTEQRYHEWRLIENLPFLRLGVLVSLATWLIGTTVQYFWSPEFFAQNLPYVAFIIVPLFSSVTALSCFERTGRWATPGVIACQMVGGCVVLYLFHQPGVPLGAVVVWAAYLPLLTPIMRLSPGVTLLAVCPYTALLFWWELGAFSRGEISALEGFAYFFAPVSAITLALIACAVIERTSRQTFSRNHLIQRQGKLIRRYVPPAVAKSIEAGEQSAVDVPQRRRITVLFSDVMGFTNMADRLDAESLTQVINEYMAAMANIVEAHGGTLNEFAGDGLMALFGAPEEMASQDQAINAVKAGQAMHAALPKLNESWLKLGIGEPMRIRIGINTGVLSVGSFGSQGRMTYTAIGLQTNIAARIQAHCEPGGVLLSDASWQLVKDIIPCEQRGQVEIKGVHFPVTLHAPLPGSGPR